MNTELVMELIKLAAVGLVAGLFSSVLANRNHRKQAWWELRVGSYRAAIEALSDLIHYFDTHYNASITYTELSSEERDRLTQTWRNATRDLRRLTDSGAFLFSVPAETALRRFLELKKPDTYWEFLDESLAEARTCLRELVEISKNDLRLTEGLLDKL